MTRPILTFFYGSYINLAVLRDVDIAPETVTVARLFDFDLTIRPLANLVRAEGRCVYGILVPATHDELERLYAHARDVLGGVYRPEAVLVETADGAWRPALCYIAAEMEPAPADPAYVERIAGPAREYGFPEWYVERIESFRS